MASFLNETKTFLDEKCIIHNKFEEDELIKKRNLIIWKVKNKIINCLINGKSKSPLFFACTSSSCFF